MKRTVCFFLLCCLFLSLTLPVFSFETDCEDYIVAVGPACLPLPEYPVGSCITTDGEPCVNHNHCISVYTTPEGTEVDTMGWQCMGFARYVFYRCFGYCDIYDAGVEGCYYPVVRNVPASKVTASYLQGLLGSSVLPGAHIRIGNDLTGHSMVYMGCDETYVYTYEGNYDRHCGVTVNQRTWAELVSYIRGKGKLAYIHMPENYPTEITFRCDEDKHLWQKTAQDIPDCTVGGTADYKCRVCLIEKTEDVAPAEHTYVCSELIPVGRYTDGLQEYRCSVCGSSYEETVYADGTCPGNSTCPGCRFTDMPERNAWSHESIDWALTEGLFSGTSDNTFSPDLSMTRAMLVTVLYRMEGTPPVSESSPFTDIDAAWYENSVSWAAANDIVSGTGDGKFSPSLPVTREQIATILYRYADYKGYDVGVMPEQLFPDADQMSEFACMPIYWAVENSLMSGIPLEGVVYLQPKAAASRAQVASLLMRFILSYS